MKEHTGCEVVKDHTEVIKEHTGYARAHRKQVMTEAPVPRKQVILQVANVRMRHTVGP